MYLKHLLKQVRGYKRQKIFCIGLNKTGTTTLQSTLAAHGFKVANQRDGEILLEDWFNRDFSRILKYTKTAQFFQDVPFSLPYTYIILSHYYPKAKFILSLRDSAEIWYNSIVTFHSKLWADGKRKPTITDLESANYIRKGFAYDFNKWVFDCPADDPYNSQCLISFYNKYNSDVRDFFKSRPNSLLEINVGKQENYFKLCKFLNVPPIYDNFPWLNKTSDK